MVYNTAADDSINSLVGGVKLANAMGPGTVSTKVVAAGGASLTYAGTRSETAWSGTGGGTSMSTPQWVGLIANTFAGITTGLNGTCATCSSGPERAGYRGDHHRREISRSLLY